MARFKMELPTQELKDIENIYKNSDKIFGEMTKAGAEVVYNNVLNNMPTSFKNSNIKNCLKITKTYKTPSDDGINTKVAFYGYFINDKKHGSRKVPAPLVANVFEYGSTKVKKRPFMRKSFKKGQIESVMRNKQSEMSGGLLDE